MRLPVELMLASAHRAKKKKNLTIKAHCTAQYTGFGNLNKNGNAHCAVVVVVPGDIRRLCHAKALRCKQAAFISIGNK